MTTGANTARDSDDTVLLHFVSTGTTLEKAPMSIHHR